MSVPASDGLILKGALTYPPGAMGGNYPLAVLAHQYPATRNNYAPLIADSIVSPRGRVVVAFGARGELVGFLHYSLGL
jgi:hypothetical protein